MPPAATAGHGPRTGSARAELALGWCVILAALALVTLLGPVPARVPLLVGAIVVAGLAWWRLAHVCERAALPCAWIVAGAVLLRLVVLAGDPGLSDDINRYIWEAEVIARGVSPYAHAPDAPRLAELRAELPGLHAAVNHPETPAAYPPVVQALGLVASQAARLAGGEGEAFVPRARLLLRLFAALADLLVLVPLGALLRARGAPPGRLVVWAWSPLVALEFAGSGHFDALGIALWIAALASLFGPGARPARGMGLLAAAAMTKLLPLCSLPFALRGRGPAARALLAWMVAISLALVLPLLALEGGLRATGLADYGLRWESSSLCYRFVEAPLALVFERDGAWSDPRRLGRAAILALWLGAGLVAWRRGLDLVDASWMLLAVFLVLSPTLHPWYLTWAVPFLALRPRAAWLWLVALAPLSYWVLARWHAEGVWQEPGWLWPVLALPFFVLLARDARRSRP